MAAASIALGSIGYLAAYVIVHAWIGATVLVTVFSAVAAMEKG